MVCGVLRQTVNEDEHVCVGLTAYTAHFDTTGTADAHTITQDTTLRDE